MDTFGDSDDEVSVAMDYFRDHHAKQLLINNDVDDHSRVSRTTANFLDYFGKDPRKSQELEDFSGTNPWFPVALYWVLSDLLTQDMKAFTLAVNRDEWRENLTVCLAIAESFFQVLQQLNHPGAHQDFNMNEPTKSLCERVLTHLRDNCMQLSAAEHSYANHFAYMMIETAKIAERVINLGLDEIQLPEDGDNFDYRFTSVLPTIITGKLVASDTDNSIPAHDSEIPDDDLVGLHDDIKKIKEGLLSGTEQLEVIPIIGMGGIGKTTLATRVYEDLEIVRHFHVLAWTTVSQKYQKRDVLLRLLQLIAPLSYQEISTENYEQLGELLCKRLRGRRYLIVVDDIWAVDDWDDIKQWFPDDENCSRIVLTSRLREVGVYANFGNPNHYMNFLGVEDSWRLLCKRVFPEQTCPPELVNFGLQIAEECQGLPLAIVVIAGHLSKISMTPDCWENVAKRVSSLIGGTEEQLSTILSLSYNDLPQNLKACFCYMGTFPKSCEIPVQKLIRFWTAAGFLEAESSSSLDEIAEKCLEDLISRSLIVVKRNTFDGRVKHCGIHDLLWDLSLIKARQEGEHIFGPYPFTHTDDDIKYLMGLTSTFLYHDPSLDSKSALTSGGFKDLRILDVLLQPFIYFPDEIIELVNLRYLALSTYGRIPRSVWKLCHLETLVNDHRWACSILPEEIWLLPHLRHLHVGTCACVPDPSSLAVGGICVPTLLDLRTLSSISSTSCTKEVFLKVPNVKQLEVHEVRKEFLEDELLFNCLSNLVYLHELQKLKLKCGSAQLEKPRGIPPWISFVPNIKQLTLLECHLDWDEMNNLARLPNLEVLKLKKNAFRGLECEQYEAFPQLKFLLLQSLDLMHWKTNKDHFPKLHRLVVKNCIHLLSIPNDFSEIPNLQSINLDSFSHYTVNSAKTIQEEQQEMGNDEFNIQTGYLPFQYQLLWLAMFFIYMTLRLKKQWGEHDSCCTKTEKD